MQYLLNKTVSAKYTYFAAWKPYGVLCQFTDKEGRPTLSSLYNFPPDVYAVGRLDMDSEGLVLLTNDKIVNNKLLNPEFRHEREYLVQVEGIPSVNDLRKLETGVIIEGKKTLPAKVRMLENPPDLSERIPPIRVRKNIPASWLSITLIEGRNRQVRKMTAHIGFPTLRLLRIRIGKLTLNGLTPGQARELDIRKEPIL